MIATTQWLSTIFTDFQGAVMNQLFIEEVTTDSRAKTKNSLFIPLVGENFDGHDYVKQAYDNGAVAIIWNKEKSLPRFLPTDFPVFYVSDTLGALQELAAAYRNDINPIVVGITGSNGKTTTKDIVASVVNTSYRTHHTKGNFNNQIGLPLTILSMPRDTEMLVLEMGMNHFGEIELLSKIARPDFAIITNIGESHIEYLGSRAGIAKAKLEMVKGMKQTSYLLLDGDEALLTDMHNQNHVITCGFNAHNDVIVGQTIINRDKTTFHLSNGNEYTIPLLGKHHALNATFAITLGERLGIPTDAIKQALLSLEHTSMRFELVTGPNGVSIINDAYNASPTSMKAAIEVVKQMDGFAEKVLILGDIFELGDDSASFHQSIADVIDDEITALFTYGDMASEISSAARQRSDNLLCIHFTSKEALLDALQPFLKSGTLLLFKASRGMQFETLVEKVIHLT